MGAERGHSCSPFNGAGRPHAGPGPDPGSARCSVTATDSRTAMWGNMWNSLFHFCHSSKNTSSSSVGSDVYKCKRVILTTLIGYACLAVSGIRDYYGASRENNMWCLIVLTPQYASKTLLHIKCCPITGRQMCSKAKKPMSASQYPQELCE